LTKTEEKDTIIINRSGRSTYPEQKSVRRSGATPIGVALFGSLLERKGAFMTGVHMSLVISTLLFAAAGAAALLGARTRK
jgi:hypothetical protein